MPSYTLNNWDGSLSNSQEHMSSQRQPSPSNTIYSRSTPIPAQKNEKSSINGIVALNERGHEVGGEGSAELVKDPLNGIASSQGQEHANLFSTLQNGSHALSIRTTFPLSNPLRAPELSQPAKLIFTPILESPLHAKKTLTRRDASEPSPLQSFPPPTADSPPWNNEDNLDEIETISMYTMDAEGELEDEELIVEGILASYSPTKPRLSPKSPNPFDTRPNRNSSPPAALDSPLFTPLPSEESISVDRLFTPDPEIQKKNPPLVMSHVQVPPLRRPKSQYRFYKKITARPVQSDVQVHDSLEHAMRAAFSNNEDLGTMSSHPKVVSKKKKPKERKEENVNAVAGPSTLQPPSAVNTNKKRSRKDDHDCENGRKGKKRSRTLVDLTLSGDEQAHAKIKSAPSARTRYKAETDTLLLYLGVIHSVPISVLAYNTRFLRNSQPKNHGISPPDNATANDTSGHRYFIPPKLSVQVHESEDIVSLGDPLTWEEEDFRLPVDDDSDDEVVIVQDSRVNVRLPPARIPRNPRPPPRPLPPKIDLAAEMRKKQIRKKQKDHVSVVNSPKPSPSANYVVATSSSSSTGLYAENYHQHNRNESQHQRENVVYSMPSAKALGKRKATYSDLPVDSFSSQRPAPVNTNGPPILANQPEGLASNLDVFLHTYTRSPSPDPDHPTSSAFVPYSNLQSVCSSSFYSSAADTAVVGHNARLVDSSATMSTFYRPDLLVDVECTPERFLSETVLDSLEAQSKPSPSDLWSALEDEASGQYAFATIDPTLLGGQPTLPDLEPEFESQSQLPSVDSETSSPASRRSLDIDTSLKDDYEPSTTTTATTMEFVRPPTSRAARRALSASASTSSASARLRDVPRRLHSQRKMPDMVPIADLDLPSSSSSGYESSSSSSGVGSESSAVAVSPVKSTVQPASQLLLYAAPSRLQDWPAEENESYCHQCRNKTRVLKMRCSCGKLFCARCITNRYPPGKFDYAQKQNNNCPYCQGCCNCTACCSKRGDTYVSSVRRGGPKNGMTMPPLARRERVSLGGKTNLPPPSQLPSEPVKYWGAVYSLTGQKMTSTFAPPTQEGRDHPAVVFGLLNSGEGEEGVGVVKPKKRQLQPKRVFVGVVQRHWGYSKHRRIKELIDASYAVQQKKKKKHHDRETRWYVGHGGRLFWPRQESEYCSLLDGLSPLSSLEDEDEEDDEDQVDECEPIQAEEKSRAASLGEDVVGQVIALALGACGTDSKVFPALA